MIIERVEPLFVKLQDFTGVPKWRWLRAAIRGWALVIASRFFFDPSIRPVRWMALVYAPAIFAASFVVARMGRESQRVADSSQMVVPARDRDAMSSRSFRAFGVVWLLLQAVPPIGFLSTLDSFGYLLMMYLISFHTYPMTGTSLRSRIKGWLSSLRSAKTCEAEQ